MRLLALCLWALQPVGALLSNLQTEWLTAPLAIAAPSPRFTWLCDSATSYRVLVTQTFPPPLTPVWDSGAVAGSGNAAQYAGPPLAADADFELSVTCNSTASSTTATSTFSTAPTGAMLSQAVWIGGAPLLRTSIALPPNATPARARLCISGVGLYHAWVNGARVSAELSPGFSRSYYARLPYDCLDISALLQPGENAVGVETGSGKFHYMEYCDQTTNSAADCNAAIALVSLALAGSSSPAYYPSSPLTWRTARGGTLFEHLYHGEAHDARAEPLGWAAPGYNDSAWAPASAMPRMARFGPLAPSVAAPVVQDWSSPASTAPIFLSAQRSDLSYVMDFGSNRAGGCQLALEQLPAGTQLTLLHGEQLAGDGSVYDGFNFGSDQHCPNRNGGDCANQTMRYTARGGVGETFFPRFSYAGFRYVQLWGWPLPTPPPLTTVTCPALHTALQRTAGVAFPQSPRADAMVNALLRTHLSNLVSLPTDCPQREKRGWTGDGQLTSASAATWLHMAAFYENWVGAMAEQQTLGCAAMNGGRSSSCGAPIPGISYAGSLGDVAPLDGIGSMPGDPSWEVAAVVVPSVLLEAYGDVPFLNATFEQSPSAMLQFFTVMAATGTGAGAGLLPWSSLGDWKAIDFATPVLVANFHFLLAAQGVAALAAATGRPTDAAAALALAARISAALPGRFWNAARACWDEKCSQAAQVLSLVVGAGGEALAAPTRAALLAALPENASLTVGATGARYVFQALALAGRADIAAGLLLGEAYPSFGFMIEPLGAAPGTFWEDWGCNQKASCNSPGPNSTVGTSDNHIFLAGGLGLYLQDTALGIAFAYRPTPPPADPPAPCEPTLGLPFDAAARFGLGGSAVRLACALHARGDKTSTWEELRALARAEAAAQAAPMPPAPLPLTPRLAFVLSAPVVKKLGAAQGWRVIGSLGNATLAWQSSGIGSCGVSVRVRVPGGLPHAPLLEVPAELLGLGRGSGGSVGVSGRVQWAAQGSSKSVGARVQVGEGLGPTPLVQLGGGVGVRQGRVGEGHAWVEGRAWGGVARDSALVFALPSGATVELCLEVL